MPLVSTVQGVVRDVVLATLPHGGQRAARRNAWSSMSADATMARARREAAAALAHAAHAVHTSNASSHEPVRSAR